MALPWNSGETDVFGDNVDIPNRVQKCLLQVPWNRQVCSAQRFLQNKYWPALRRSPSTSAIYIHGLIFLGHRRRERFWKEHHLEIDI